MAQKQTRKQTTGQFGTGSEVYILKCEEESRPTQAAIVIHTRPLNHTSDLLEGIYVYSGPDLSKAHEMYCLREVTNNLTIPVCLIIKALPTLNGTGGGVSAGDQSQIRADVRFLFARLFVLCT